MAISYAGECQASRVVRTEFSNRGHSEPHSYLFNISLFFFGLQSFSQSKSSHFTFRLFRPQERPNRQSRLLDCKMVYLPDTSLQAKVELRNYYPVVTVQLELCTKICKICFKSKFAFIFVERLKPTLIFWTPSWKSNKMGRNCLLW